MQNKSVDLTPEKKRELLKNLLEKKQKNLSCYPLSPNQERLWQSLKLDTNTAMYNIPFVYDLEGHLNLDILVTSIRQIIKDNDNLRCHCLIKNREIQQEILTQFDWKLDVADLSNLDENEKNSLKNELIKKESEYIFNLEEVPLWKIKLLKLTPENYLFILNMHHLISDRWSIGIFMQELAINYQQIAENNTSTFTKLAKKYQDFSTWQKTWLETEEAKQQINYWQKELAEKIPDLKLPIDIQLNLLTYKANRQSLILDEELTLSLQNLSKTCEISLFILLFSAFQILLFQYNQQEKFIISSPVAGRHLGISKEVIGYFNNLLPFKVNLTENPTFKEVFERVKFITNKVYQNQDIPFQYLTELTSTPLARVMFALQNIQNLTIKLPNIKVNYQDLHNGKTNFDLFLFMEVKANKLEAILEYKTDLFNPHTIKNILNNFQILLIDIVNNPNKKIKLLPKLKEKNTYAEFNTNVNQNQSEKIIISPRTLLEKQLTEIWQEVLNIEIISIKDNFFSLGGHSLLSVKLIDKVEEKLLIKLSLKTLQQLTTIEEMALNIISDSQENNQDITNNNYNYDLSYQNYRRLLSSITSREEKRVGDKGIILEINEGLSNQNNVFFIGNQFNFLLDKIKVANPIYTLPNTWMEIEKPVTYVRDLARFYSEEIIKLNQNKPLVLIGYCFEALVAWEMAQILIEKDIKVNQLIIIEREGTNPIYHRYHKVYLKFLSKIDSFSNTKNKFNFKKLLSLTRLIKQKNFNINKSKLIKNNSPIRINKNDDLPQGLETIRVAINSYYPNIYNGKVSFIFARENKLNSFLFPMGGWENISKGKNKIYMVSGKHQDLLIESKSSTKLAQILENLIRS